MTKRYEYNGISFTLDSELYSVYKNEIEKLVDDIENEFKTIENYDGQLISDVHANTIQVNLSHKQVGGFFIRAELNRDFSNADQIVKTLKEEWYKTLKEIPRINRFYNDIMENGTE